MAIRPEVPQCTHTRLGGQRCGSPAMCGEQFCYFHMRVKNATTQHLDSAIPSIMLLEDAESVQGALMQIMDLTLKDQISVPKARVMLRAAELAWKNLKEMEAQRRHDQETEFRKEQRIAWNLAHEDRERAAEEAAKKRAEEIRAKEAAERAAYEERLKAEKAAYEERQKVAAEHRAKILAEIHAVADEGELFDPETNHVDCPSEMLFGPKGAFRAQDRHITLIEPRLERYVSLRST